MVAALDLAPDKVTADVLTVSLPYLFSTLAFLRTYSLPLRPARSDEVLKYLAEDGAKLTALRQAVEGDPPVTRLAQTPLMLSVMRLRKTKRTFLEVSGDIVERVDPVFFSDPIMAAMKALGIT
jgi:hypothetical protein